MNWLQQLRQKQLFPSTYEQVWHCRVRELSQPSRGLSAGSAIPDP